MSNPRKRVLIIGINAVQNPMLQMYALALGQRYDVSIACPELHGLAALDDSGRITTPTPWSDSWLMRRIKNRIYWILGVMQRIESRWAKAGPKNAIAGTGTIDFLRYLALLNWDVYRMVKASTPPDLVIAIDGHLLPIATRLSRRWKVPLVYAVYEIFPNQYVDWKPTLRRSLAIIERRAVRQAARVITFGPPANRLLGYRYGVAMEKFEVIYTCPQVPSTHARQLSVAPLRLYYHGALFFDRGIEYLIRAMIKTGDAQLFLRGFGSGEATFRQLVKDMGLNDRVFFLAPIPMAELAAAAVEFDVGVVTTSPITANGRFVIGFKFFENMAAGLAQLVPRTRILGPFLAQHAVGTTYRWSNEDSIAERINYCVSHPDEVVQWKREARRLAELVFNAYVQGEKLRCMASTVLTEARPALK